MRQIVFLTLCLLLSACSPYQQESDDISREFQGTFDQSLENQQMAMQQNTVPKPIQEALAHPENTDDQIPLVSLSVNEMPIAKLMAMIGKQTELNIIVSPQINQQITLNLNDTSFETFIQIIEDLYPIDVIKKNNNTYVVIPEQLITKTFHIAGLYINRKGTSSTRLEGSTTENMNKSSSSIETSSANTDLITELEATLKAIVGDKNGTVNINKTGGTATVTTTRKAMKHITKVIEDYNNAGQKQIIIETKILEIQLNKEYKSGLEFSSPSLDANVSNGMFKIYNTPRLADNTQPFNAMIEMLKKQGRVHVLSSPRLSTLNRQKALIKVGEDKYFMTQAKNTTTINTAGNIQNQSLNVKPYFTGIALDVTPEVFDNSIIMHIHPVITSIKPQVITSTIAGVNNSITVPSMDIRESDVMAHAKNGEIIMIGGLIHKRANRSSNSLPFGDDEIPIGDSDNIQAIELVILLHPRIVGENYMINHLKELKKSYQRTGAT